MCGCAGSSQCSGALFLLAAWDLVRWYACWSKAWRAASPLCMYRSLWHALSAPEAVHHLVCADRAPHQVPTGPPSLLIRVRLLLPQGSHTKKCFCAQLKLKSHQDHLIHAHAQLLYPEDSPEDQLRRCAALAVFTEDKGWHAAPRAARLWLRGCSRVAVAVAGRFHLRLCGCGCIGCGCMAVAAWLWLWLAVSASGCAAVALAIPLRVGRSPCTAPPRRCQASKIPIICACLSRPLSAPCYTPRPGLKLSRGALCKLQGLASIDSQVSECLLCCIFPLAFFYQFPKYKLNV